MRSLTPLLIALSCVAVACGPASGSPAPTAPTGPPQTPLSNGPSGSPTPATSPSPEPSNLPPATAEPSSPAPSSAPPSAAPTHSPTVSLSADEAALLEQLRADSRVGCAPRRTDLPPGSDVGVECRLDTDLVDRVGVYGFDGSSSAVAYLDRMKERGVALGSGDCAGGRPGDSHWPTYLPDEGPDGTGPSELRIGCYRDASGVANVRLTCYGDVYIGILGKGRDIAPLYAWAQRVAAGESTDRDPPGICARPD